MLRLSKPMWNNVLIISMVALILILNMDRFSSNNKQVPRLIVPEGEYILSMQINQVKIEKAASQWRINAGGVQPSVMPTPLQLQNIVSAWQTAYIRPSEHSFNVGLFSQPSTIVTLTLAGNSQATVVAFSIVEQQLFIVVNKKVYELMSPNVAQLLSPIVTVKQ